MNVCALCGETPADFALDSPRLRYALCGACAASLAGELDELIQRAEQARAITLGASSEE